MGHPTAVAPEGGLARFGVWVGLPRGTRALTAGYVRFRGDTGQVGGLTSSPSLTRSSHGARADFAHLHGLACRLTRPAVSMPRPSITAVWRSLHASHSKSRALPQS